MSLSGRLSCVLLFASAAWSVAQTPTPTPTPAPTPIPNEVDLSKFVGRYPGTVKVSLDSGALHVGQSKVRFRSPTATSARIVIAADIAAGDRVIPVGNTLTFTSEGVMRGQNLAPGVLTAAKFAGLYTATPRQITFSGTYKVRKLTGRFTGIVAAGKQGRFTLRYSIFPGESVVAAYIYQYVGRARTAR